MCCLEKAVRRFCGFVGVLCCSALLTSDASAEIITFGSGVNSFGIDFVEIGDPGNVADTAGEPNPAGSVDYTYRISKYEISRDMVIKATSEGSLLISLGDLSLNGGNGLDRPATGITWYEAAIFTNWLNTSKGLAPAYKFNGNVFETWSPGDVGYDADNPFRNSLATYVIPSVDEWYKAAYFDPINNVYYDYALGSNTPPTPVASGTDPGTAVYNFASIGPADVFDAGGLSPYGVMGLGGNVTEWNETAFDLVNNSASEDRSLRDEYWYTDDVFSTRSLSRFFSAPTDEFTFTGFRVADVSSNSVPEPSSIVMALGLLSFVGIRYRTSRRRSGSQGH